MTGLFLDISDYIPSDEELAVDSAIAYLRRQGVQEDYIMIPSAINDMPKVKAHKEASKENRPRVEVIIEQGARGMRNISKGKLVVKSVLD